jgi:hypothetical protein
MATNETYASVIKWRQTALVKVSAHAGQPGAVVGGAGRLAISAVQRQWDQISTLSPVQANRTLRWTLVGQRAGEAGRGELAGDRDLFRHRQGPEILKPYRSMV